MSPVALPLETSVVRHGGPDSRLLVLLHGYGEPATALSDRLALLDPDRRWTVAVPEGPFERRGRAIWHRGVLTSPDEAAAQFRQSVVSLDALLGDLQRTTGLEAREAVVGGFSQGGGLGLALLLAADIEHRPAAGFGICSFPPAIAGFRFDRRAATGRPYFLSSARRDHFAPIESSRAGAALLRSTGLDLTYVETDDAHELTDASAASVGSWLDALADGRPVPPTPDLLDGVSPTSARYDELWEHVS